MVAMGLYYYVWIKLLPKLGKYQIRTETVVSDQDGSVTHRLRNVKNDVVDEWDQTHDEAGNLLVDSGTTGTENGHLIKRVRVKDATEVGYLADEKA